MKIITILSLCLTASLSFVHSQILDKTNDDAFTYDYSRICEKECFRFTLDTAYDPYGLTNSLIDPFDFTFQISSEPDPEAEYIKYAINKFTSKMKYGFPSTADANAYFNIQILSSGNYQNLGSISWITNSNLIINEETLSISPSQSHFIMPLNTTIIEHFREIDNPDIFHNFLIEDIKKLHQNEKLYINTSLIIPRVLERLPYHSTSHHTQIYSHSQESLNMFPQCPEIELENDVNIFQTNKDAPIKFIETRELSKTNFYDFSCPITTSTDGYDLINTINHKSNNIYIQKIKIDDNSIKYHATNTNKTEKTIFICSEIPKFISTLTRNECDRFKLAPLGSIEINID